jgi:DNA-binding GntR family transcriptional regulator
MAAKRDSNDSTGYLRLREAIVHGELAPNQRLVEADVSSMFRLPRGAVRSALLRLEHEGLVEREPHRGARVRQVSEQEAVEILQTRAVLEGLAARHAALKRTDSEAAELQAILAEQRAALEREDLLGASDVNARLHARIVELSDHHTMQRLVRGLKSQTVRFQFRTILMPGRPSQSAREHAAIVEAIVAGDASAAERAMRTHIDNVAVALGAVSEQAPPRASAFS